MKKNFIVIGLGRFGMNVAKTLAELKFDVLAIDIRQESVANVASIVSECAIANPTKQGVLEELGVSSDFSAVVAIGNNLQASVLTVINLKNIGVKNIIVRADEESHKEIYKKLGATDVILPEEASAISLANKLASDTIVDYYEVYGNYVMVKLKVGEKFEAKELAQLDLRNTFDVNIVGILSDHKFHLPKGSSKLLPGYILVVVGTKDKIKKFDSYLNE